MAGKKATKVIVDYQQEIQTRLVLNFPGFEKTDSKAQIGRIKYCAEQSGKVWNYRTTQFDLEDSGFPHSTIADHLTEAGNWQCTTRLVQFRWNDIVHAYENDRFPLGFLKNTRKYFDFFLDGTVMRYFKASARYWGFTIFPVLFAIIFALASFFAIRLLGGPLWLQILAIPFMTLILCKWPGDFFYIPLTIADWGFARDMVNQNNPQIEARFVEFGQTIAKEIAASKHDEIVVVGHSFGSLWAVSALANALKQKPDLLKGKRLTFLAQGSSLLKIALAPGAKFMRDHWQRVMDEENVFWHEVQTKDDIIAFYRCDPLIEAKITDIKAGYVISRIRFSKGMERKRYRKMRLSLYQTHRQYILYYDERVDFDYMLRLFGPFAAKTLALNPNLHRQLNSDGELL